MSKWTPDQERAIYESGSNILVSAGAGSGKTAVLSERVIEKVKSGIHVNELLILTFTKAAASEMKDRIRDKLSKDDKYKEELNLINSSYITTFDSFALSVLKKYHYLLNIPKNISICDEAVVKIKHDEIINDIFEELYLTDDKFREFIKKNCVKNDKSLRDIVSNVALKIDSYIDKYEYIDYIINDFYSENNINDLVDEYYQILEYKRELVKLEFENLSYYFDGNYIDKVYNYILYILESDVKELYKFSKGKFPSAPKNSLEDAKNAKKMLSSALDELLDFTYYKDENSVKENILFTKELVLTVLNIVKIYIDRMNEYKQKEQIYTFNDVAYNAIKILKENEEARNELKYSFKEIMIDEYQDTNDVQDIFMSYIENNNVYMVGDIKQAIYRFRGSNPNIFKNKYDMYSDNSGGIKIDLIKNFRSRDEVLKNINEIFELIMDYNIGEAKYKESHKMVFGNDSYNEERVIDFDYNIDIFEYTNEKNSIYSNNEIEIFAIGNDIKEKINRGLKIFDKKTNKLRNIKYNDFVIICDRSKYFNDFKRIFEYLSIPLSILKDENLNSSTDISLIKNIIDFIIRINNNDFGVDYKYDLLSIGRSFLYEMSDQELFDIFKDNKFTDNIIYNDFIKIESINSKTSSMIFEEILNITDFYNKIYKIGDYENTNVRIKSIYEISCNLSERGYNLNDFKEYLDTIIEKGIEIKYGGYSSNSDSVKILTIHKSKGLEYPICYFADLDHDFNLKDSKEKICTSKKYGLIVPSEDENKRSVLKEIYQYDYIKEEISEKIRLFYVALTRAREKMIMFIPSKDTIKYEKDNDGVILDIRRIKYRRLSDLVYSIRDYLPQYFKSIDISKINLTKDYLYKKDIKDDIKDIETLIDVKEININNENISEEHFSKETSKLINYETSRNMKFGTLVHEMFELIDMKNFNENDIEDEFIRNKIKRFLDNDIVKNIKNSNIYHEYEFEYEKDNTIYHGIIDLMLEYDDHIDIIDFKLKNVSDNNYVNQLNGYKKYIENISNKTVNLYLYSIIDEKFSEIK